MTLLSDEDFKAIKKFAFSDSVLDTEMRERAVDHEETIQFSDGNIRTRIDQYGKLRVYIEKNDGTTVEFVHIKTE